MKLVRSNEISILRRTQCCLSVCCTFQYNFHTNAVELEIELDFSQLAKQTISRNVAIEWFPENISVTKYPCVEVDNIFSPGTWTLVTCWTTSPIERAPCSPSRSRTGLTSASSECTSRSTGRSAPSPTQGVSTSPTLTPSTSSNRDTSELLFTTRSFSVSFFAYFSLSSHIPNIWS